MAANVVSTGADAGGGICLWLLGSPKLERSHKPLTLATRKALAILAYLALENRAVPKSELATLLWPEQDENHAKRNLRDELVRLNQVLGEGYLHTTRQDVCLLRDKLKVDLWQLEQILDQRQGDIRAVYKGSFLDGFFVHDAAPFESWLAAERERLQDAYLLRLEQLAEEAEELGNYQLALDYLGSVVKTDPFRELAQTQFIRLTALLGERMAALKHFETLKSLYKSELDLTPPQLMLELVETIAQDKLKPPDSIFSSKKEPANNLLTPLTPIIGRESLVDEIKQYLSRADLRLLTLTGPGGVGKTRLSLQVAKEVLTDFADGIFFIELAPIQEAKLVLSSILKTLGIAEAGDNQLETLSAALKAKQLLLILDNFEHVIEAKLAVVDLLRSCPKLKILITSRHVLHVSGEFELCVEPLLTPERTTRPEIRPLLDYPALKLFRQRARAVNASFDLDEHNSESVAEICRRLDGLPLAIELAASRIKLMTPEALLQRLETRFLVLTGGPADLPKRQQTLKATLQWSFEHLTTSEQNLLRHLAYLQVVLRSRQPKLLGVSRAKVF